MRRPYNNVLKLAVTPLAYARVAPDVSRVPWKLRKPPRRSLILPHAA